MSPEEGAAARVRGLPSVDRLATAVARAELADRRRAILAGETLDGDGADLVGRARARLQPSAARVLNATGVVLHTNLGRAPLAPRAREAVAAAAEGYSALELDLAGGRRARRGRRAESMVVALTGAQDALIVNNGAAAVLLAAAALVGPGLDLLVSRGELIEIGGGLRIADIVRQSGARLAEVGATNRTRAGDYAAAIGPDTAAILRVHQSNFQMVGYTARPGLRELVALGPAVIDDLGSGALDDGGGDGAGGAFGGEPTVRASIAAGAALVCWSGDKLLGGPQAGIIAGTAAEVAACRAHPLARALRIDKLCLAALEATLELHLDGETSEIPVRAMLELDPAELDRRTAQLAALTGGTVIRDATPVGGGSMPGRELAGPAVALPAGSGAAHELAARLRTGDPPVIARVHRGDVVLSARTLTAAEIPLVAACVARATQP